MKKNELISFEKIYIMTYFETKSTVFNDILLICRQNSKSGENSKDNWK